MTKRFAVLALLATALTASAADAQQRTSRPIEFGIDGGITVLFEDPDNTTAVNLPVQAFRIGFFMNDRVSIEPRFSFNSVKTGDFNQRSYALELGVLFHPGGYRTGSGLYIRPFGGVIGTSGDLADESDGYLGAGVGVKLPFWDRRLAARLEANYAHVFSDGGDNMLGLLFGLSFFR